MSRSRVYVTIAAACAALCASAAPGPASAATIVFEIGSGNAQSLPYEEGGFTFTDVNAESAVFGPDGPTMYGNSTGWLGFAESNTITLTPTVGGTFDLTSVLVGPSDIGAGTADVTLEGFLFGGGSLMTTLNGLTTATTASPGWTNLTSVEFTATDDIGIDDIVLNVAPVPEPGTLALCGIGLAGLAYGRRRSR